MTLFVERRELLARFRAGDRRALEETYRHYAKAVATFLSRGFVFSASGRSLRFVGYSNSFDVDNALSETFLRAFQESARLGYDGIHPYKTYLLSIARNFVIDELRRQKFVSLTEETSEPEGDDGRPPSAEDQVLATELGEL